MLYHQRAPNLSVVKYLYLSQITIIQKLRFLRAAYFKYVEDSTLTFVYFKLVYKLFARLDASTDPLFRHPIKAGCLQFFNSSSSSATSALLVVECYVDVLSLWLSKVAWAPQDSKLSSLVKNQNENHPLHWYLKILKSKLLSQYQWKLIDFQHT